MHSGSRPQINHSQLSPITTGRLRHLQTMPRTFGLFSITHTTIILVDSNLNMIQGDLRHMDRSTTFTNRDPFNIESTVTEQQFPPNTSLVVDNNGKVVIGSESRGI
jgi:hypothetical protein